MIFFFFWKELVCLWHTVLHLDFLEKNNFLPLGAKKKKSKVCFNFVPVSSRAVWLANYENKNTIQPRKKLISFSSFFGGSFATVK